MNSSRDTSPLKCGMYYFIGGVPEHFSTQTYSVVVFNIVILAMACPFYYRVERTGNDRREDEGATAKPVQRSTGILGSN